MYSKEVWFFLFMLGLMAFSYPIMDLVGVALPYYLYAMWALLILIIGLLAAMQDRGEKK